MFKTMTSRHSAWMFSTLFLALSAILLAQQTTPDQQKAMEMYMKLGEVNENHAYLKQFVGDWKSTATMWVMPDEFV